MESNTDVDVTQFRILFVDDDRIRSRNGVHGELRNPFHMIIRLFLV